jgi:hypothetical protein
MVLTALACALLAVPSLPLGATPAGPSTQRPAIPAPN